VDPPTASVANVHDRFLIPGILGLTTTVPGADVTVTADPVGVAPKRSLTATEADDGAALAETVSDSTAITPPGIGCAFRPQTMHLILPADTVKHSIAFPATSAAVPVASDADEKTVGA
jgi:hypothetical protein